MRMRWLVILMLSIVMYTTGAWAGKTKNEPQKVIIPPDDLKVIEMMEFLEMMDVLEDSDTIDMINELDVLVEDEQNG